MSAIIKCKSGNNVYLYESESYRENGKVKNKRRIVGKVDPISGQHIFKPEYIEEKGIHALGSTAQETKLYTVNDVKQSIVKEYGAFYLLNEIAGQIGLTDTLTNVMPTTWKEILNIAFYIVVSGEPASYCEDWLYKSECHPCRELFFAVWSSSGHGIQSMTFTFMFTLIPTRPFKHAINYTPKFRN